MEYKDYYKVLGVSRDASQDELKKSYRKLARKYHPDVSKVANAEERFKEVGEAYEALKDPEKRAQYDQFGSDYKHGQSFNPPPGWAQNASGMGGQNNDFSSFFESMFSGNQTGHQTGGNFYAPGANVNAKITISLEDAFHGAKKQIRRPAGGTQAGNIEVKIPAGITNGKKMRLAGEGKSGAGGEAGDLFLEISIASHPHYQLDDNNLLLNLPIAPWEAALGAKITVPTLAGKINLTIPAGAKSGQKMRLKGRGLPSKNPGDQIIILQIMTPPADSDKSKQLYQEMAEELNFNPRHELEDNQDT